MQLDRAAGVLLHITSLPCRFGMGEVHPMPPVLDTGVGDLGPAALGFVDFLQAAGQKVWQVLPLGPTVHGESPYSCYSAFAGNPLLISLDVLVEEGLLESDSLHSLADRLPDRAAETTQHCDYERAHQLKSRALRQAFDNFLAQPSCASIDDFEHFCVTRRWWLDDFALFTALMKKLETDDWTRWDSSLVQRNSVALGRWKEQLSREIEFEQFVQYVFYRQWHRLREYANQKGVLLFGDMPIFVAHGSADVWAHQSLFDLDAKGNPKSVAGVPPDYFSATGQLWGNPLYNWEAMEQDGYRWWVHRLRAAFEYYDLLRIDHFRGFESYWAVPAKAKTAASGSWNPGPGTAPFKAARKSLGELAIVAEDLGLITDDVHALRDELGFPGMRVLQFGFDHQRDAYHRPNHYPDYCVAYTGTHDNSTIVGWYQAGKDQPVRCELLEPWLEKQPQTLRIHWQLLSLVYHSKARLAMAPMQDILGLDDASRMNIPGKPKGNWRWRCAPESLTDELTRQLREMCAAANRC